MRLLCSPARATREKNQILEDRGKSLRFQAPELGFLRIPSYGYISSR